MRYKKIFSFIKKKLKYFVREKNYFLNKQYIPHYLSNINIENTSVCNLKCRFCAYEKRDLTNVPLNTMSLEFFKDVVNQCIDFGYKNIGLTPVTGDVFMDKRIIEKLDYLDELKNLDGFYFYTNFIPANKEKIDRLLEYKKLSHLGISIYGHDEETFKKFSKGTSNSYNILIKNLNFFYNLLKSKEFKFKLEIGHRTTKDFNIENSFNDLSQVLKNIKKLNNVLYDKNHSFNNWGGLINENDIEDLNVKFQKELIKKTGSCALIYSRLVIGANGLVNACACRDANFSLRIGSLKESKLSEIISYKNSKYKELIENQEKNIFHPVCEKCDFYKSIYEKTFPTWILKDKENKNISLKKFKKILS
ncbi:radical SAM protein [Pelagibacterales bacterium SAG-MED38]|nr:radical SAM protein [Pelagibacterales bacterium SAG-MED38]